MRITELFTAQSIALDEAQQDRSQIIDRASAFAIGLLRDSLNGE